MPLMIFNFVLAAVIGYLALGLEGAAAGLVLVGLALAALRMAPRLLAAVVENLPTLPELPEQPDRRPLVLIAVMMMAVYSGPSGE